MIEVQKVCKNCGSGFLFPATFGLFFPARSVYLRPARTSVSIEVRTFHSFGLRLLREYSECIGLGPDFEIASSSTVNRILTKILNRHGQTLSEKKSDRERCIC